VGTARVLGICARLDEQTCQEGRALEAEGGEHPGVSTHTDPLYLLLPPPSQARCQAAAARNWRIGQGASTFPSSLSRSLTLISILPAGHSRQSSSRCGCTMSEGTRRRNVTVIGRLSTPTWCVFRFPLFVVFFSPLIVCLPADSIDASRHRSPSRPQHAPPSRPPRQSRLHHEHSCLRPRPLPAHARPDGHQGPLSTLERSDNQGVCEQKSRVPVERLGILVRSCPSPSLPSTLPLCSPLCVLLPHNTLFANLHPFLQLLRFCGADRRARLRPDRPGHPSFACQDDGIDGGAFPGWAA
jgi:hypothetical protein